MSHAHRSPVHVGVERHAAIPRFRHFMRHTSNGYDAIAAEFIAGRGSRRRVGVGVRTVRDWATTIRPGGAALDLGCGPGYPITQVLVDAGLAVHAVDASPTMVAQCRARFPGMPVECRSAETSDFFGRAFDGVVAWGLLFLLRPAVQAQVIVKVAGASTPGGEFLFTAPRDACVWSDAMTGRRSQSLGAERYHRLLETADLVLGGELDDDGDNHYYLAFQR